MMADTMEMFNTGIVVLTTSTALRRGSTGAVAQLCAKFIQDLTYVHLINDNIVKELKQGSFNINPSVKLSSNIPATQRLRRYITEFYTRAERQNIRFLLSNITNEDSSVTHSLNHSYDVILTDLHLDLHEALKTYLATRFPVTLANKNKEVVTVKQISLESEKTDDTDAVDNSESLKCYGAVCLGGTFDRLHVGHKILLSEAALLCNRQLTVGVTTGEMNNRKVLFELMEPLERRISVIREFLEDIKPLQEYRVIPISDPYGPTIHESNLDCLVVSQETIRGGDAINNIRKDKGMSPLSLSVIELVEDSFHAVEEEHKVSSSSGRRRLLGTLLKKPEDKSSVLESRPYLIGLTGSTASGKSSIAKRLQQLGAGIIDCDQLGHKSYLPNTPTFHKLVETFGEDIVNKEDGTIDRRRLGGKVFGNQEALEKLNSIVWPAISDLAQQEKNRLSASGCEVVILDAAVLLKAGWDKYMHEIWATIAPREEVTRRLMERNKLTEAEAVARVNAQCSNEECVEKANVLLCTLWEPEITQKQVVKAWTLLQERLPKK